MALSLLAIHEMSQALLDCACDALGRVPVDVPGLDGCPCRSCVVPGAPAADACGSGCGPMPDGEYGGQLTVNVIRTFGSDRQQFPREVLTVRDTRQCFGPPVTAVEMAITLFRCVPGPTQDGCPPSCDALNESATQLHVDLLTLQQGVICCFAGTNTTQRNGRRYVLGQSRVIGPQGGCVGIEQRVIAALDDCLVCPPETPTEGP